MSGTISRTTVRAARRAWLVLAAVLVAAVALAQPAAAAPERSKAAARNLTVQFQAVHSARCLDVELSSTADRAPIVQFTCVVPQHPAQTFELRPAAVVDGLQYYQLVALHSGKCLDVRGSSTADGTPIIQFACVDRSAAQQFRLATFRDTGNSRIVARHSQKCLQARNGGTANLTPIVQSECSSDLAQQWRLRSVS